MRNLDETTNSKPASSFADHLRIEFRSFNEIRSLLTHVVGNISRDMRKGVSQKELSSSKRKSAGDMKELPGYMYGVKE